MFIYECTLSGTKMKYGRYDFKIPRIFFSFLVRQFVLQPLFVLQRRCSAAHFLSAGMASGNLQPLKKPGLTEKSRAKAPTMGTDDLKDGEFCGLPLTLKGVNIFTPLSETRGKSSSSLDETVGSGYQTYCEEARARCVLKHAY